jgi:hypothetical protein
VPDLVVGPEDALHGRQRFDDLDRAPGLFLKLTEDGIPRVFAMLDAAAEGPPRGR